MHSAKISHHTPSSRNLEDTLKSPTHLFLNKSLSRKGSTISVNELGPPPPTPGGIRAQIGHLLPRHANFRARIQIHQISSVPFVSGEFGVRWKFKSVQSSSVPKKGLLGRVKSKAKKNSRDDKGKGRELDGEWSTAVGTYDVAPVTPILANAAHTVSVESKVSRPSTDRSTSLGSAENSTHISSSKSSLTIPSHATLHWADTSTLSHISSATPNASHMNMLPDPTLTDSPDPLAIISTSVPVSSTLRRGTTPFLKLKDHSVTWSHTLDTLLKFDIDRETYHIQPNPLKLVVMQRVIPDDPDGSPQNPRLGAVYLNLAEYIGKGSVERKYLLKESKTNAVLKVTILLSSHLEPLLISSSFKLTIELEHVSGETTYIAPPLAKGEILNGIAGFLDDGGVRKRPRALNLHGPYRDPEELEDLLGTAISARFPKSARSQRGMDRKPSDGTTTPLESDSEEDLDYTDDLEDVDLAFDIQRLPHAYGTKTTETIIEALFNPIKINDMKYDSPFTIYEPSAPEFVTEVNKKSITGIGLGLSDLVIDHNAAVTQRQNSLTQDVASSFYHYSTGSSSTSLHTTGTSSSSKARSKESGGGYKLESQPGTAVRRSTAESSISGEDLNATATTTTTFVGVRGWWRRHKSRPQTPMTARV